MTQKNFIPNSFQTSNLVIDSLLPYLSGDEFKVLMFFIRHINGWHNLLHQRRRRLSVSTIRQGFTFTADDGAVTRYAGTGLALDTIRDVLKTLERYHLLRRCKTATGQHDVTSDGQLWELLLNPDYAAMEQDYATRQHSNDQKMHRARAARRLSVTTNDTAPLMHHMRGTPHAPHDPPPHMPHDPPPHVAQTHINTTTNPNKKTKNVGAVFHGTESPSPVPPVPLSDDRDSQLLNNIRNPVPLSSVVHLYDPESGQWLQPELVYVGQGHAGYRLTAAPYVQGATPDDMRRYLHQQLSQSPAAVNALAALRGRILVDDDGSEAGVILLRALAVLEHYQKGIMTGSSSEQDSPVNTVQSARKARKNTSGLNGTSVKEKKRKTRHDEENAARARDPQDTDWYDYPALLAAVRECLGIHGAQERHVVAMLRGEASVGAWAECNLTGDQRMTADKLRRWCVWYKSHYPTQQMVQKPEAIQKYILQWYHRQQITVQPLPAAPSAPITPPLSPADLEHDPVIQAFAVHRAEREQQWQQQKKRAETERRRRLPALYPEESES